jgi:hypothetical protein
MAGFDLSLGRDTMDLSDFGTVRGILQLFVASTMARGPGLAHAYWLDSGKAPFQAVHLKSPGCAGKADRGRPRSTFSHPRENLDPAGCYAFCQ